MRTIAIRPAPLPFDLALCRRDALALEVTFSAWAELHARTVLAFLTASRLFKGRLARTRLD